MKTNSSKTLATIAILMLFSFIGLVTVAFPSYNLTYGSLQNFGHFALFAVLAFLVLQLFCGLTKPHYVKSVLISAAILILLGAGVELFQSGIASRTASVSDFVLDVAGITIGFLAYWSRTLYRSGYLGLGVFTSACIVAGSFIAFKPSLALVGFDLLRPSLPVVRVFDHPFATSKIATTGSASYNQVPIESSPGNTVQALRVTFFPEKFSGIVFLESPLKWSDYAGVSLDIFNSMSTARQIELRINDRLHNNQYEDRYNGSFSISPGLNEIQVSISTLVQMGRQGLSGRKMNVDDISEIQLFINESETAFTLDILQIKLF